jgi:ribonucleotide reductase beta subunit family protein with ferritin-like domain/putative sterol carrier protein
MWFKKKSTVSQKDYFTKAWINEWKESINSDTNYQRDGSEWNAPVVLLIDPIPEILAEQGTIGFYLNLQYGQCLELRYATQADVDQSDLVLSANEHTWIRMIAEKKDPTMMIMKGKMKLEKGSLVTLSTQRKAAKALLNTAPSYSDSPSVERMIETLKEPQSVRKEHTGFVTTGKGIDFNSFPMQLFQKAKKFGIWNPSDISFSKDYEQWKALGKDEQTLLIHLSSLFMAGEEAVTLDLIPLIQAISKEGRIEEEIYLTSFLWEEAKHTEFFSRFVAEVMVERPDFEAFHGVFYKRLFYEKLPYYLNALFTDTSPLAQLKASGTYNMIVEGTLAETGYEAYYTMLKENDLLPGLQQGITLLKQDESRHIAYGLYLINRLLDVNPQLKQPFENHLEELLNDATNIIHEIFEPYDVVPFGLEKEWFLDYAMRQFQHRINKLGL